MQCNDVQALLPEFSREALGPAADAVLREHLQDCRVCSAIAKREQQLFASLRALPVAAMRPGFAAAALRQAQHQADAGQDLRRRPAPMLAMAASVLMVCGLAFMLGRGSQQPTNDAVVSLPLGQAQMVALKIDAPQAFEHVQFEVSLPANVALADQPELREFAWSGQLQAGVNVLSLPLVGVLPENGQLVATVTYGKTRRSLNVPLSVAAADEGLRS